MNKVSQAISRSRQLKVIQSIFHPDDTSADQQSRTEATATVTTYQPEPTQRKQRREVTPTRHHCGNRSDKHRDMAINTSEDDTMGRNDDRKQDLTMNGVPNYDTGEEDNGGRESESIKAMITAMRSEFRTVGIKVDAFEKHLNTTQSKVDRLAGQMTEASKQQNTFQKEARAVSAKTDAAIDNLKTVPEELTKDQENVLQQLQKQVLQELDDKNLSVNLQENGAQAVRTNNNAHSEWIERARQQPQTEVAEGRNEQPPKRYTEIARKEDKVRPQTTNKNGALTLLYVKDWKDESVGTIKKALRNEIGQQTGAPAGHNGRAQIREQWPNIDAVRHINIFGSPTSPLMEIACTPDKAETVRNFFMKQDIQVYYVQLNPCIYPAVVESNEADNRKIATRLRNHFGRILLAWWKAAHYIYSPDTRLFYRRQLLQLIAEDGKLYDWPAFITEMHIDASNVNNRKDNPRIWFQYKPGYEYLTETEAGK